ncbi:MAG TPA: hypothetical protein VF627_09940 [Abditibacterium sp.]|jgi:hypothetical protein
MHISPFSELADFLVAHISAEKLIAFRPSAAAQQRFDELSSAVKSGTTTPDERAEVEQCLQLEHLMGLVKAQARRNMAAEKAEVDSP